MAHGWSKQLALSAASAVVGATLATIVKHAWEKHLGPSHGVPHPLLADTLNARLDAAALTFVPSHKVVLGPRDLAIDAALGGKTGEGRWRYWSQGEGDLSGVLASYLLGKAGWPKALVNRAKDDAWAPGDGFSPGASVAKAHEEAKKRGWLVTPVFSPKGDRPPEIGEAFRLEPGDYVATGTLGDPCVGIVLSVGDGGKERNVELLRGFVFRGEPRAEWQTVAFSYAGKLGDAPLLWVIRPT